MQNREGVKLSLFIFVCCLYNIDSKGESDYIVKNEGWKYEGISWYAAKLP